MRAIRKKQDEDPIDQGGIDPGTPPKAASFLVDTIDRMIVKTNVKKWISYLPFVIVAYNLVFFLLREVGVKINPCLSGINKNVLGFLMVYWIYPYLIIHKACMSTRWFTIGVGMLCISNVIYYTCFFFMGSVNWYVGHLYGIAVTMIFTIYGIILMNRKL